MPLTHSVISTRNAQLGVGFSATYRSQDSCPDDCALTSTCYAIGRIFHHAKRGDADPAGALDRIATLCPPNWGVRHHVSGDLLDDDGNVDWPYIDALNKLADRRPDLDHILFTHAWKRIGQMPFRFPAHASVDDPADVDAAQALGWQIAIVSADPPRRVGSDVPVISCPAKVAGSDCTRCRRCTTSHGAAIHFPPHGISKRRVPDAYAA